MNFKVGDEVVVITGSDKGKKGKIIKTLKAENKVIVEGVHVVKKHKKRTRIGHTTDTKTNKKIRITKKSNEKID